MKNIGNIAGYIMSIGMLIFYLVVGISFINNQKEVNKQLKTENNELKEENEKLWNIINKLNIVSSKRGVVIINHDKDIQLLKEANIR
jgi:LAS superfamily LD-carboxypeptidase LdcB